MYGPELVHVVALVSAASGVHKGGLASDEQRGLMHADRVWPGKDGACLSVLYLRVGEEQ